MSNNNLKEILDIEGISERELSEKSTVSVGSINRIANRHKNGSPKTQSKIVKGINACNNVAKKYTIEMVFPKDKKNR